MSRGLLPNDELSRPGEVNPRWQVLDPIPIRGHVRLFNCGTNAEEYVALSTLNQDIISGALVIHNARRPSVTVAAQNDQQLAARIQCVHAVLRDIDATSTKLGQKGIAAAYRLLLDGLPPELRNGFPSRASVYRYVKARAAGLPVLRGDANKGNRLPRYCDDLVRFIRVTAKHVYLVEGSRWTLRTLTRYVNDHAVQNGWIATDQQISRNYVAKNIAALSVDPDIQRMDSKLVGAQKAVAGERIRVTRPLQRVEQDALHLPFHVKTKYGIVSNVWLVHAIDCASGLPIGWTLSIGAPTAREGLLCVERVLYPKGKRLAELGIQDKVYVDAYGTPSLIVFDNGPEARNERMHRLVKLGIDVVHRRAREPQGKPYIERLNRALKEALETLPGCTRMDGKDGARDPIALGDALMSLEELEAQIVLWYYQDWAHRTLARLLFDDVASVGNLGTTPERRWIRMTSELAFATPLSPPLTEWRMALYEHEIRKLSRKTGITVNGFNYRGTNLKLVIDRLGEVEVTVLIDPDDYRQVYVDMGDNGSLVPLTEEFTDSYTPAYSVKEAVERRRLGKADDGDERRRREHRLMVQEFAIEGQARTVPKRGTRAERNREVTTKVAHDRARQAAAAAPLPRSTPHRESGAQLNSAGFGDLVGEVELLPVVSRRDGGVQR